MRAIPTYDRPGREERTRPRLGRGVHPKFVQELLGHATIAITLDNYSHVLPGMGDQTAAAMENVLS